ncbi:aspartate/glutamate racemase family protein [Rhizobium mongolense]|nr:aspartate/glutamate racemase family protein [Rhizobium mongolense]
MPRIALIHATTIAVDPIRQELAASWPDVDAVNILEDSLSPDRAKAADITPELTSRITALTHYACSIGSDAVLFTCSAFGTAIEHAAGTVDIPVLKPNEAMFEAAIEAGGRVAMLYTFPAAGLGMEEEFREQAATMKSTARMDSFLVQHAIDAVRVGDAETHNRLVSQAASKLSGYDAIVLAHFSTARALDDVRRVTDIPVFSSPKAAVQKLRRLVVEGAR